MRVAMLGQRGLPATWGGIERHVEEISTRLVAQGVDVTVFGRSHYSEQVGESYRGITLKNTWGYSSKHFDALSHTMTALLAALQGRFDIIHFHGLGPSSLSFAARLAGHKSVVTTVHGMDHRRQKWGSVGRAAFGVASHFSLRYTDEVISVSQALVRDISSTYGVRSIYVPNGVSPGFRVPLTDKLRQFGLTSDNYILAVGRIVPEKGHLDLVRAFQRAENSSRQLVIAGGSSNSDDYERQVREIAASDHRIVLPGYIYGDDLAALYSNASLFAQPSYVEGMPLTLLEAVSHGLPILASAIPVHSEVLLNSWDRRLLVSPGDIEGLARGIRTYEYESLELKQAAGVQKDRVLAEFSWDRTAQETLEVYKSVVRGWRLQTGAV